MFYLQMWACNDGGWYTTVYVSLPSCLLLVNRASLCLRSHRLSLIYRGKNPNYRCLAGIKLSWLISAEALMSAATSLSVTPQLWSCARVKVAGGCVSLWMGLLWLQASGLGRMDGFFFSPFLSLTPPPLCVTVVVKWGTIERAALH